jgi:glycosyltransferase involved in cell wall biosynthesis
MKILHVETGRHLYGGAQQVFYLVKGLNEEGIDNILVCQPESGLDTIARDTGLNVVNLSCAGVHDLAFAFRLRQLVLAENPDLVHCHSRRGGDFLSGLAATGTSIPAVISRRVDNLESPLIAGLRYLPFRKVIAISEAIAAVLKKTGLEEDRLAIVRSAVDTDRFSMPADCDAFRSEFGLASTDVVVAVIAQLIPRKGHRYLLEAVAQIKASHPDLKVVFFGQGPLENELREQTASLGLGGTVQFEGFRQDLDDYLACIDLLVHPALAEGLGIATLKAAAAKVAVVACAAGGLTEAVVDGETGLLVAPKDVGALARAIAGLLENPERRRQFGEAGRARMQRDFSIQTMVNNHVQLYEQVLNG